MWPLVMMMCVVVVGTKQKHKVGLSVKSRLLPSPRAGMPISLLYFFHSCNFDIWNDQGGRPLWPSLPTRLRSLRDLPSLPLRPTSSMSSSSTLTSSSQNCQDPKLEDAYQKYAHRQRQKALILVNFSDLLLKVSIIIWNIILFTTSSLPSS